MTHRFYVGESKTRAGDISLTDHLWLNDQKLCRQIISVLRMRSGENLVLFDGNGKEVLYRIDEIEAKAVHLLKVTDMQIKLPYRKLTLAWSLLKKDKNEWVIQKCTELGVSHFVPLITDRTEKTGFDESRAHKIAIEASEQCGRHDIPSINDPIKIDDFIGQHVSTRKIIVLDMDGENLEEPEADHLIAVIGPEGGWSIREMQLFKNHELSIFNIGNFTLRAETACLAVCHRLV